MWRTALERSSYGVFIGDEMTIASSQNLDEARARLERAGQGHALRFFDELGATQQAALLGQIAALDLESLPALVERYVYGREQFKLPSDLEPAPYFPLHETGPGSWDRDDMYELGEELISAGKVAAFTAAGGQGTRLGYDGPKGA